MIPFSLLLLFAAAWAPAKQTEPGQQTVWDRIMEEQAARDLHVGAAHLEARRWDLAVREFAKAVLARPEDPLAHLMLGSAYYWTGEVPRAEAEFKEALRLDPKNPHGHLLMGIVNAWRGDNKGAYASFQEAAKYAPDRADVQMNLGSIEETMGLYAQALDHFRKAASLDPDYPLYHYQLGMLYSRLGREADAEAALRQALRKAPDFEDAVLELGAVLERQGRLDDAQGMFKRAVRLKARDSVARLRLGRVHLRSGETKRAREAFREAFHLTPEESGGGLALSVSFGGKAPASGASMAPETVGKEDKPPTDAMDVLSRNLERIPLDQQARLKIELAILPQPRLEKAPSEPSSLKKALEDAGRLPRPQASGVRREYTLLAGKASERREQIKKIVEDLRGVLAQSPADAQTRMAMQLAFSKPSPGPAAGDAGQRPRASYQPRAVGNDMGLWVVGTGWMTLVEEVLSREGEAPEHPDEALWWVCEGLAFAALGEGPKALAAFDRALERDPQEELALLGRAVAFVEMGRDQDALATYRRVLELHPKSKPAREGLSWLQREPATKP